MLKLVQFHPRSRLGAVFLLASVVAGGLIYHLGVASRSPAPVEVDTLTVERETVKTTLNESGIVMLKDQQTLTSPTEGAVDRVFVQAGDQVEAGQVLLTLRYPERQTALAGQQVKIQQQQRLLQLHQQHSRELQTKIRTQEGELRELNAAAQEGAVARQQVYQKENQIRDDRIALQKAQTEARTAELELENLQLERQRIQQELSDTVITAPMAGMVLSVEVKNGDGVEFRTKLITLGDPSQVLVKLELPTLTASQVKVGQLVRASIIGPDAQSYTGRIQSLSPMAAVAADETEEKDQSGNAEQPTVSAIVQLDTPTRDLIPGSRVNVEIVLQQRQNVVALPTEAIQRSEATPFIWIKDTQGKVQKRLISLGLEGLNQVEVKSGLQPGEQVILPLENVALEPGMVVESMESSND